MPTDRSTTIKIESTDSGAQLHLQHLAPQLDFHLIPESWRAAPIIHLAPVAQEVEPAIVRRCSPTLLGVTPRGWLRTWDDRGRLTPAEWPEASFVLNQVNAAVVDWIDIDQDRRRVEELAAACPLLAVYDPMDGASVFWQGDEQRFEAHKLQPGAHPNASDIFAALFFARLYHAHDPWDAARFATVLAGTATERIGLQAIPTQAEVHQALSEGIYF
jgi:sugar/nucleoside kinase (ribokinase family)